MILDVNVLPGIWTILGVAASFLVATIALFLGINSGKQINKIRKDEKREHNLREIINWAIKILGVNRGPTAIDTSIPRMDEKSMSFSFDYEMLLRSSVNILTWEGSYIEYLAEAIDDKSLIQAVENTRLRLGQHIKVSDLHRDKKLKDGAAVGRLRTKLDDEARDLIRLAVEIL